KRMRRHQPLRHHRSRGGRNHLEKGAAVEAAERAQDALALLHEFGFHALVSRRHRLTPRSVAAKQGGVLAHFALAGPDVAELTAEAGPVAPLETHRRGGVALGTIGPRAFELEIVFLLRLLLVLRRSECREERYQIVLFG